MIKKGLFVLVIGVLIFLVYTDKDKTSEVTAQGTKYIVTRMAECLREGTSKCYRNVSDDLFQEFELPVILEIFEQNEDKQEIFARCHEVAHYLGRQEFLKTKSVPLAYSQTSSVCHGGSYHGVIEGYFEYKNIPLDDTAALENEIKSVCGQPLDYKQANIYNECIHGIGHAMMFVTEGELIQSLEFCDSLLSHQEQITCYGGVFMENSSSSTNLDHPSKYIKTDDPLYPCTILEERYLETCYSYQSSHFALISHHDWAKVIELCRLVAENYRAGCFRIIGTNQVGFSQDMTTRRNNCDLIREVHYKDICFNGVVTGLVGRYHRDFTTITSFCVILAKEYKESCYRQTGFALMGWTESPEDLRRRCETITEGEYIRACLEAVNFDYRSVSLAEPARGTSFGMARPSSHKLR
jgi:hypothetical protein